MVQGQSHVRKHFQSSVLCVCGGPRGPGLLCGLKVRNASWTCQLHRCLCWLCTVPRGLGPGDESLASVLPGMDAQRRVNFPVSVETACVGVFI